MENLMLANLEEGQILLTSAKKVKGGKVQIEFAQKVALPNRSNSIAGLLNSSDERFNVADKPRFAWQSGEQSDIEKIFKVDLSTITEEGQIIELNILNPTIAGKELNIQLNETTKGTPYDVENYETRAKRAGKDGDFITTEAGEYIYTKASIVTGTPRHSFIENTVRENVAKSALSAALEA
jgi:hypothetical protein